MGLVEVGEQLVVGCLAFYQRLLLFCFAERQRCRPLLLHQLRVTGRVAQQQLHALDLITASNQLNITVTIDT